MTDYLPEAYTSFRSDHPDVAAALDGLGAAADSAGPLDERSRRLVKLALAVGAGASGAVRSNVRKSLSAGVESGEIEQVAILAMTTVGFPAAVAGLGWMKEVLEAA